MKRRSGKRIVFDLVFLSFHIGKWVVLVYTLISVYQNSPFIIWPILFLILGIYIARDLYRGVKAIIKDTSVDNLEVDGEFSYVKGMNHKALSEAKNLILLYLFISLVSIDGIIININAWKEDGQNRIPGIVILSLFAAAPVITLINQVRKE